MFLNVHLLLRESESELALAGGGGAETGETESQSVSVLSVRPGQCQAPSQEP